MWPQEIEEQDYQPMTMADESRWQHANFGTCSFDCDACDPYSAEEEVAEFDALDVVNLDSIIADMWERVEREWEREFAPDPWSAF